MLSNLAKRHASDLLPMACLLLCSTILRADTITLSFNSLPSAQGWTYESDGVPDSDGVPETSIFSVSNGVLTQNTLPAPFTTEVYELRGAIDLTVPFTISVRARVLANSRIDDVHPYGFCFAAETGAESFAIGLSPGRIEDSFARELSTTIDNTTFHDYRLSATPGVGYEFFVDGVLVATGPPLSFVTPSRLLFGDCTRARGALAEITSYSVTNLKRVRIDIKPGSDPNSINLSAAGVIPVAILSSETFDATTVDPSTVSLAGAKVKMVGKSNKFLCHTEDVNGDGRQDLVCQVTTAQFMIETGSSVAVLEAETFGGQAIRGEDSVNIVPDP